MLKLLREGETPEDLLRLSPDQLLLRWVNYHMEGAGCDRRVSNFSVDIKVREKRCCVCDGHLVPSFYTDHCLSVV